ncbi:MAG TPA: hypothetical protein VMX76_02620 [Nevskiaceae bacterium]|nr:hypothetical protein [Nevskiaceae bacterium]
MKKCLAVFLSALFLLALSQPALAQIIYPENSIICNDFEIEYQYQKEATSAMTPLVQGVTAEERLKELSGELRLEQADFPDFSSIDANFYQALQRILPAHLQQEISLPETPLNTQMTHFVIGRDEDGNPIPPQKKPETTFSQPGWFTKLLGETKILCGLFGTCPAPKGLAIKVTQPALQPLSEAQGGCSPGSNILGESTSSLEHPQQEFISQTWWQKVVSIIEDLINRIIKTKTTETASFQKQSRGYLVGGRTLTNQAKFLDSFLPASIAQPGNGPLTNNANFYLSEGFSIQGEENLNYPLVKTQKSFCSTMCALHPANINITEVFPFCPSCNPDDYQLIANYDADLGSGFPVPPQACSADAPHEIIPSCTICDNILFCYGNKYRRCETDSKIPAPTGNLTQWLSPSDFPTNFFLYNSVSFPVPGGGVFVCDANVFGCANKRCR